MCKSPSDLNLGRSSSFSRFFSMVSFRRGFVDTSFPFPFPLPDATIGMTTSLFAFTTTSMSTDFRVIVVVPPSILSPRAIFESKFSLFFSGTFWFSKTTLISSSFSLEWLMVIVFFGNFFVEIGLDAADAELVRLPRENLPLSAKFWTVDCCGSRPRIFEAFWNWKSNSVFVNYFLKMGLYLFLILLQSINMLSLKIIDDCIRTAYLWYWKQPLCQLRQLHPLILWLHQGSV